MGENEMKFKKLIVIIAIIILIFGIQATCTLEEDGEFNLTQTSDIDAVNVQWMMMGSMTLI